MTRLALALALLVGCTPAWVAHARPPTHAERVEVARVASAWRVSQQWSSRCDEAIARLRVAPIAPEDVGAACYSPGAGACLSVRSPRVVILPRTLEPRAYAAALRHEAIHLMSWCALGHSDKYHRLPGVWERRDRHESIEWRSRP